jgi:hypothetical protein
MTSARRRALLQHDEEARIPGNRHYDFLQVGQIHDFCSPAMPMF